VLLRDFPYAASCLGEIEFLDESEETKCVCLGTVERIITALFAAQCTEEDVRESMTIDIPSDVPSPGEMSKITLPE